MKPNYHKIGQILKISPHTAKKYAEINDTNGMTKREIAIHASVHAVIKSLKYDN